MPNTPASHSAVRPPRPEHESGKLRADHQGGASQFQKVTTRTMAQSYCGRGVILGASPDLKHVLVIPIRCNSWDCPTCHRRKAWRLAARIASGRPTKFITLTLRPDSTPGVTQGIALMKKAWRKLVKQIRREFSDFEYALVWELTKAGHPHVHVAARCRYIPQRWLSNHWRDLTGSPVVDIRAVRDPARTAKYVTKYMLKSPYMTAAALDGHRLVQFSRDYAPQLSDPVNEAAYKGWHWSWIDTSLWQVLNALPPGAADYAAVQAWSGSVTLDVVPHLDSMPDFTIELDGRAHFFDLPRPDSPHAFQGPPQEPPAPAAVQFGLFAVPIF